MHKVRINLFGHGRIFVDDKEVSIPRGKLTGIVFYLAIKKSVTRDELAFLFWPDSKESNAKSSLRNALHKIKNYTGCDLIYKPNQSILELSRDLDIEVDARVFEDDPVGNLDLYSEFLQGFYIKDLEEYDIYLSETRSFYENLYIRSLESLIVENYNKDDYKNIEKNARNLLKEDPYNHVAYYYIMLSYKATGHYDKLINTFYQYKDLVERDLGISLDDKFIGLKDEVLNLIEDNTSTDKKDLGFISLGRDYQISRFEDNLAKFKKGDPYSSLIITGEYGTGKSSLINHVLKTQASDLLLIDLKSSPIDEGLYYSLAFKIQNSLLDILEKNPSSLKENMDKLDNLFDDEESIIPSIQITENKENYDSSKIFSTLNKALKNISKREQIVLVIEDIQWLDKGSIQLISNLIMQETKDIIYIISLGDEKDEYTYSYLRPLIDHGRLENIGLKNYSKNQVRTLVKSEFTLDLREDEISQVYDKSRGNPFFLYEYLDLLDKERPDEDILKNTHSIIQEKMSLLTQSQWDLVNLLSASSEAMNLDYLIDILGHDPFETIRDIRALINLKIIVEDPRKYGAYIDFSYQAYKDYVYKSLPEFHKQVLHRLIADKLSEILGEDDLDLDENIRLRHHYSQAKDQIKALKYDINILNYQLYFNHEVYPDLSSYRLSKNINLYASNQKSKDLVEEIEDKILRLKSHNLKDMEELEELELKFLIIKGRFLIRIGQYEEGTKALRRLILISKSRQNKEMQYLGYKQIIVSAIQLNDTQMMIKYLKPGLELARDLGSRQELGIFNRLYGLYYLMLGDFENADRLFDEALELFSNPDYIGQNNDISIAAIYNYKAEILNSKFDHIGALENFNKAISLCENIDANCRSIFYLNAGITSFLLEDFNLMKEYLYKANEVIRRFDSYWKSSMLYAFLGLIKYMEGDYKKAQGFLERAQLESTTINDPRDIGTIYFIDALIKKDLEENQNLNTKSLDEYLAQGSLVYYFNANKYLSEKRDRALIVYLNKKFKNN